MFDKDLRDFKGFKAIKNKSVILKFSLKFIRWKFVVFLIDKLDENVVLKFQLKHFFSWQKFVFVKLFHQNLNVHSCLQKLKYMK